MKQETIYTYILYGESDNFLHQGVAIKKTNGKYVIFEDQGKDYEVEKHDLQGPAENGKIGGHLVYIGKL